MYKQYVIREVVIDDEGNSGLITVGRWTEMPDVEDVALKARDESFEKYFKQKGRQAFKGEE